MSLIKHKQINKQTEFDYLRHLMSSYTVGKRFIEHPVKSVHDTRYMAHRGHVTRYLLQRETNDFLARRLADKMPPAAEAVSVLRARIRKSLSDRLQRRRSARVKGKKYENSNNDYYYYYYS